MEECCCVYVVWVFELPLAFAWPLDPTLACGDPCLSEEPPTTELLAESGNIVLDDGELFFELWTGFPVKFSQELTRPCRDSSQFLVNSFSTFFFSSACNWASRVLAASLLIRFSNSLLLLSRSAKSFIVSTATACLYDTGSSSGICNYIINK